MLSPPLVESKHALKDSVNSVCSVRERNVLCERKTFLMSLLTCPFYSEDNSLSHRFTQKNRTHGLIEDSGPSPFPSPEGKGSDHRDTPIRRMCVSIYYLTGCLVGVTSHTTPLPAGEGLGEGPLSCGLKLCAKNLRELCALCERKIYPL